MGKPRGLSDWYYRGRKDAEDRTPWAHAPCHEDECDFEQWVAPEMVDYWAGWNGGVRDAVEAVFRAARAAR